MENKYELIVNFGDTESPEEKTDRKQKQGQKALASFVKNQAIMPFINMSTNHITQNVGLVTGSQQLQQTTNFITQSVHTAFQANSMRSAGVLIGQQLGIGGVAGGTIGLALFAFQKTLEIGFKQAQINLEANRENIELQQTRSRAGVAFNRSRQGA